jgi:hypothetical protein
MVTGQGGSNPAGSCRVCAFRAYTFWDQKKYSYTVDIGKPCRTLQPPPGLPTINPVKCLSGLTKSGDKYFRHSRFIRYHRQQLRQDARKFDKDFTFSQNSTRQKLRYAAGTAR